MIVGRKINFFLRKTKKHPFGAWPCSFPTDGLLFSVGKVGFPAQSHLVPREVWFFTPRQIFFLAKSAYFVSFVVCARYALVLPIKFVERHYYWESIPLSVK